MLGKYSLLLDASLIATTSRHNDTLSFRGSLILMWFLQGGGKAAGDAYSVLNSGVVLDSCPKTVSEALCL